MPCTSFFWPFKNLLRLSFSLAYVKKTNGILTGVNLSHIQTIEIQEKP